MNSNHFTIVITATFLWLLQCTQAQIGTKILIIHGGAGTITPDHGTAKKSVMVEAIREGYRFLQNSDDAESAVIRAISMMEDSPAFNAGRGGALSVTGEVELDAVIVNGTDLSTGAIGAVRHIKNPIQLAKLVKDRTEHVFLVGYHAEMFALEAGVQLVPTSSLLGRWNETVESFGRQRLQRERAAAAVAAKVEAKPERRGTVGAVAINSRGQIFAGTSTGGMTGKLNGRVGDAPIIGCGTLADDLIGGISATGWGEAFIRYRVASRIAALMEAGTNATMAINTVLQGMAARIPEADGGVIAIGRGGEIGLGWNSEQMAWAYSKGVDIRYGVDREEIVAPLNM